MRVAMPMLYYVLVCSNGRWAATDGGGNGWRLAATDGGGLQRTASATDGGGLQRMADATDGGGLQRMASATDGGWLQRWPQTQTQNTSEQRLSTSKPKTSDMYGK